MKVTNKTISKLLKQDYGFSNILKIRKLESGQGEVFEVITKKEDYILKLYDSKKSLVDWLKIKETIRLLLFLKEREFSYEIPVPIPEFDGNCIARLGSFRGILYKKIKGNSITKLNKNTIEEIAEFQAEFHKITEYFNINKKIIRFHKFIKSREEFSRYYNFRKLKKNKDESYFLSNLEFMKKAANFAYKKLPKQSKKGIIHSDINFYNLIFLKNKIKGIIDFENYNYASRIWDIAYTIKMTCFEENNLKLGLVKAFLESYSKVYDLPKNYEDNFLPTILLDNCIYFIRAYEKEKSPELHETLESSREIYRILNSKKIMDKVVTTIKLLKTKDL